MEHSVQRFLFSYTKIRPVHYKVSGALKTDSFLTAARSLQGRSYAAGGTRYLLPDLMLLTHAGCAFKDSRALWYFKHPARRGSRATTGEGMKSEVCANARLHVHHALFRAAGPQFRTAALRSNRQCGAAALRTRVPLRPLPAIVQKTGLLVQLDQTGQVLVTIVCNLLVACEQSLCTLGECTGQAAVTGLVCQQC